MKKIFLFLFCIIGTISIYGQNRYLSFQNGITDAKGQTTLPQRVVNYNKSNVIELQYNFSGAFVSDKIEKDTVYNYLNIEGLAKMGIVGSPSMPSKTEIIAIPGNANVNVEIISSDYYEYSGYYIYPALKPATDEYGDPEPVFEKNYKVYGENKFFPENIVEITNIGLSRGTQLAYTEIRPMQFNPVTGKIRVYTSIKFRVTYQGGAGNFDYIANENSKNYTNLLKMGVINSDNIPDGITNQNVLNNKSGAKNYIIITHSQYLTQANQLADWKRQLGYSVEVVSQSSWTTAQVKTAIQSRYASWTPKPDYFVIIGDHTGSYAVPGEIHSTPNNDGTFATDLYYACMDGGSDHHPDIAHGRISVSTSAEATVVIDKIINYEKNPVNNATFYDNALSCAYYQDDDNNGYADRRFCHTSENIRDYLISQAYTSTRVYNTETTADKTTLRYNNEYYSNGELLPAELRTTTFNWSGGATDITTAINAGKFLVFHRDHGYVGGSGWAEPYYTTTSMTSLTNGNLLPVVFSMNCHTGEFQLDNCFAEKFVRMENKGAVGVVGAAYYSYSGYNDALSIGMIDAIWSTPGLYPVMGSAGSGANYTIGAGNDIYTMGDVLNQGLIAMDQNISWTDGNQYQYELFHYFGDPSMKIWTANPNDNIISATHNSTIDCSASTFAISASKPFSLATLVNNGEIIGKITLDASGNGTINYAISAPTDVVLTISKHNCKPYSTTLTLTGSCNFPPTVNTNSETSITGNSATLNGEITSDNGATVTQSGFVYSTISDPVIGGPGVVNVTTSPLVTSGAFSFNISSLLASTTYYVKAYATNANGTAYGNEISFTTSCGMVTTYPFTEGFEGGTLPTCWSNEHVTDTQDWAYQAGGNVGNPASAHTGSYNAYFYNGSTTANVTKLVTPQLDFSSASTATLTFWHTQELWSSDQDELRIYYKNSTGGSWNLIATYTNDIQTWTQKTVALSNISNDYYIAFEATGKYGRGVCLDDINVSITPANTAPVATVSATPACGTGLATVSSSMSGAQTFYLRDNAGAAITDWTGNATSHEFTGLADGIYKGQVNNGGNMSELSTSVTLTNLTTPTTPVSVSASETSICSGSSSTLTYSGGSGTTFNWYSTSCGTGLVGSDNDLSVSSTSTTTYYGRWENSCGNSDCESVIVNVSTPITANAGTDAQICGTEYTLVGNDPTPGIGTWTVTNGAAIFANANLYNTLATDLISATILRWTIVNGACTDYDDVVITLLDSTAITTQPVALTGAHLGETVVFTVVASGSNLTYQWFKDLSEIIDANTDTYTINGVTADDQGSYNVEVSGDCGTVTSNNAVLTVLTNLQTMVEYGLSIYPNPNNGRFTIDFKKLSNPVQITITDVLGKIVYSGNLNAKNNQIDLGKQLSGVYLLTIYDQNISKVVKILIQ